MKGRPRKKRGKSRKDSWNLDSDNSNDSDFMCRAQSASPKAFKSDGIHKNRGVVSINYISDIQM